MLNDDSDDDYNDGYMCFWAVFDLLQMQDKDSAHEQEISLLTQRIEKLEHELQQYREVNTDAELKFKVRWSIFY